MMDSSPKKSLPPEILRRCRDLRREETQAETVLWSFLRNRGLKQSKFRRQQAWGGYILDFYCHEAHLAIKLDGGGHAESGQERYDQVRTEALDAGGIRVLRFWND